MSARPSVYYFNVVVGDQLRHPVVTQCSLAAHGLYERLKLIAHDCRPRYGFLANGVERIADKALADRCLCPFPTFLNHLRELEQKRAISRDTDGTLYFPELVEQEDARRKAREKKQAQRDRSTPLLDAVHHNEAQHVQCMSPPISSSESEVKRERAAAPPILKTGELEGWLIFADQWRRKHGVEYPFPETIKPTALHALNVALKKYGRELFTATVYEFTNRGRQQSKTVETFVRGNVFAYNLRLATEKLRRPPPVVAQAPPPRAVESENSRLTYLQRLADRNDTQALQTLANGGGTIGPLAAEILRQTRAKRTETAVLTEAKT